MSAVKSTVTSKYQTTVPRAIREHLGISPQDVLQWEVQGREVRVSASRPAFLERRGMLNVGSGDVVEDIRQARRTWGAEST